MSNIVKFVDAQTLAIESIIKALVESLVALWSGVEQWDEQGIGAVRLQSVELVEAAQLEARRVVYANSLPVYQQAGVREGDFDVSTLGLSTPDYPRFDVTPVEVWERPLHEYRKKVASGSSKQEAITAALGRVESVADMEVRLAKRDQEARVNAAASKVIGYRRIIHPELSESGVCGLCVAAATRIYSKGELAAMHPSCKCTVAPVTRSSDPGLHLNDDDLRELYRRAGGTKRGQLSNVRLVDFVSGELGPVLTKEGDEKAYAKARYQVAQERRDRAVRPRDLAEVIQSLEDEIQGWEEILAEESSRVAQKAYQSRISRLRERVESMRGRLAA